MSIAKSYGQPWLYDDSRLEELSNGYAHSDCLMIAEGVVSDDGAEVVFTPLPGAARMGITAVPAMPVKPSKDGFFRDTIGEYLFG